MGLAEDAKVFLNRLNARARKSLGQNFMVREEELSFIADAAGLKDGETALEIGPGLGFLTRFLLRKKVRLLAVEKDRIYANFLKAQFREESFELIESDILALDLRKDLRMIRPIKVVGNIPYNITSPILEWLIRHRGLIISALLTTQWEVAERLTAKPGSKSWGTLSIFLQVYADVKILKKIDRRSFYPSPKVDSALIEIDFLKSPQFKILEEGDFFRLVRRAFQKRRKTILNAMTDPKEKKFSKTELLKVLDCLHIDPLRRPETLAIPEWIKLHQSLS